MEMIMRLFFLLPGSGFRERRRLLLREKPPLGIQPVADELLGLGQTQAGAARRSLLAVLEVRIVHVLKDDIVGVLVSDNIVVRPISGRVTSQFSYPDRCPTSQYLTRPRA